MTTSSDSVVVDPYTVLVPITEPEGGAQVLELASSVIGQAGGRVIALEIVEVPEEQNYSEAAGLVQERRRQLTSALPAGERSDIEALTLVRTAREAWSGIREAAISQNVDLIFLGWSGIASNDRTMFGTTIDELASDPPADIAVVKVADRQPIRRILVPVRGGQHAKLALRLAIRLAEAHDATITVLNIQLVGPTVRRSRDVRSFAEFASQLPSTARIILKTVPARDVLDTILDESKNHDVVIMGAGTRPSSRPFLFGDLPERVANASNATVIVTKTREPLDVSRFERPTEPIAVIVDKWFAENTFDGREFARLEDLVELKQRQGLTISVGLPTLNEEQTIGAVIRVLRQELVERVPLIDELAVVDSGSTDRTIEIAIDSGVPVYRQAAILERYGTKPGKGLALWKSLYALEGDILVWLASDIKNIHPKFAYGLIGPLLREPGIAYVKGFYRRPIRIGSEYYETGGGILTELTARPLINLFFPELSGVVEPLGSEHAGRRSVLERLPFLAGHGVTFGLLVDILDRAGLEGIAQSDLEERIHRPRSLSEQTELAFGLVQAAMTRLERRQQVRLLEEVNTTMKLIRYEPDRFFLELKDVREEELPPMIDVPEYQEKRRVRP